MRNLKKMLMFSLQRFAVIKGTESHDWLTPESGDTLIYGYGGNDTLITENHNNVTLVGGNGNDSLRAGRLDNNYRKYDTVRSGISITGGLGSDNIIICGKKSTIYGDEGNDIIKSYYESNILNGGEGHDSIGNAGLNATLDGGNGNDTLRNYGENATIYGGGAKDSIENTGKNAYIDGGDSNDEIYSGDNGGVTLTGGAGDDIIWSRDNSSGSVVGGSGDDEIYVYNHTANITVAGGTGDDMISLTGNVTAEIQYTQGDGNDIIYEFNENDILYIAADKFSTTASDDNNMIVKVGNSYITLVGGADKSLDIEKVSDFAESNQFTESLNPSELIAGKDFKSDVIDLSDYQTTKKLDASALTKDMMIFGNALDNSIIGSNGNDSIMGRYGADTIYGGKGSDTLTGGKGKDTFIYANGDGKDIITDYTVGQDKIKIESGSISKAKVSGKNVVFTIGKGSVTVKNGKNKNITVIDSDGRTNIYRNSKLKSTSALFAEDNFVSADNLDSITNKKFAVAEFENYKTDYKQENLITYSK